MILRVKSWLLALALGTIGGGLFALFDLPLPWMLGALSANTLAALAGHAPDVPRPLRAGMIAVLGLMLGAAFTPDLAERAGRWLWSLAALFTAMAVTTALVVHHFRRHGAMDATTAFFAGAPGGINEMVMTGAALGGDERTIALSHSLRILLIVFTIPFGYRLLTHVHSVPMAESMGRLSALGAADALALGACALAGAAVGRLLRLPAWPLTGPLLASAAVHMAGLSTSRPPAELVILAQVVTGASIGARFRGLAWSDMWAMARPVLGATLIMLAVSGGGALAMAAFTGLPFTLLLLSFVPGGIAEMCLVALALGEDVAFVSTHHVIRVVLVILFAPLAFRVLNRKGALS